MQDQNGNVHEYDFDGLARRLSDIIALLARASTAPSAASTRPTTSAG